MNAEMDIGTNKKVFQINLDAKKYGTFAENGAGQEVARRFFHVGGAAGTVRKHVGLRHALSATRSTDHGSLCEPKSATDDARS